MGRMIKHLASEQSFSTMEKQMFCIFFEVDHEYIFQNVKNLKINSPIYLNYHMYE